jgi:PKD repeat protein
MQNKRLSRFVSIVAVLLMVVSSVGAVQSAGPAGRSTGPDASATGFENYRDIDNPSGNATYPTGAANINATFQNNGSVASSFAVSLEVGQATPVTKLYADAEGGTLPVGWTATDLTESRWHTITTTYHGATHSVWCGGTGQAGTSYGANWESALRTTNSIALPGSGTPTLSFWHRYNTVVNTDGGYVEVYNPSASAWEREDIAANWTWSINGYPASVTTSPNNPISKDVPCFGGTDSGWVQSTADLTKYLGQSIQIRFVFSTSANMQGGWYIDDVTVTGTSTFTDNFESGMAKWTEENLQYPGGAGTDWAPYTQAQVAGDHDYNPASTKCFSNRNVGGTNAYAIGEDSVLTTNTVALTGITHARLYFESKMQSQLSTDGGWLEIQVGAQDWAIIKPFMANYPSSLDSTSCYGNVQGYSTANGVWGKVVFDLTPYIGQTIRLRFHFFANDDQTVGNGWFIDDVTITGWNFVVSGNYPLYVNNLNQGQTQTLVFATTFGTEGYYSLTTRTYLTGDVDNNNNRTYAIIFVKNIYTVSLSLDPATTCLVNHSKKGTINANVINTGNTNNSIDLTVSGYPVAWTINVNKQNPLNLSAGDSTIVRIDVWVPMDEPNHDVSFNITITSRIDGTKTMKKPMTVTVTNTAPIANPGLDRTVKVFSNVQFDGSASLDAEGDNLTYDWTFGDSTSGSGKNVNHTYATAGKFTVTLTVFDGQPGSTGVASLIVTVTDSAPVANMTIETVPVAGVYEMNVNITFNASKSTDESPATLTYTWDFGDLTDPGTGMVVEHAYTTGGKFTVSLTVTDAAGNASAPDVRQITVNNPPVANISSPKDRDSFYTTEDVTFSSLGTYDPDIGDTLTYSWTSNQPTPGTVLSTSAMFTKRLNATGTHTITLTVTDGRGLSSFSVKIVNIYISERTNELPKLTGGAVTPTDGDEGPTTKFNYTVRYSDSNNDPPFFIHVIIDGNVKAPHVMTAVDPLDNNYTDGKDYFFVPSPTEAVKGEVSPHNFTFETADKWAPTSKVATEILSGPVVKWYRQILSDSWSPNVRGTVYQIGDGRTLLNGVSVTPPDKPTGLESIGVAFTMATTATADKWFWANITIKYSSYNWTGFNVSTLNVYWSVDNGSWQVVPESGHDSVSQVIWFKVTKSTAKFAVFGKVNAPIIVIPPKNNGTADNTLLYVGGAVGAMAAVGIVAVVAMRRKKTKAPPEPTYDRDYKPVKPVGSGGEKASGAVEDSGGESVKVFRPGGDKVAVFKPGGGTEEEEVKVFKPGEATEGDEHIFRPGGKEVVEDEATTPPVVQEDAQREAVVQEEANKPAVVDAYDGAEQPAHGEQPVRDNVPTQTPETEAPKEEPVPETPKEEPKSPEAPKAPEAPKEAPKAPEPPKKEAPKDDLDDLLADLNK